MAITIKAARYRTPMDQENNIIAVLAIATAATMGTLARLVYAGKHNPGRWESILAIIASAGSAVFVAPIAAKYLSHKLHLEHDLTLTCAVAWLFGVVSLNLVVVLCGLDLRKYFKPHNGGPR